MTPEPYIMGYGLGDRQYLIRTEPPRFIADIHPAGKFLAPLTNGDFDCGDLGVVSICEWIDPPPGSQGATAQEIAMEYARLARETGEAIAALDAETDRRIDSEEIDL